MDDFEKALAEASEQGSQMWVDIRCGRFTSSEIHRLIKNGERLMTDSELEAYKLANPKSKAKWTEDPTKFSPDGDSYILEKVAEVLTGQTKDQAWSHAIAWGDTWEPYAAEYYARKYSVEFEIIAFKPFGDHAGGSPDRKIVNQNRGLEIKCPHASKNQVNYLQLFDQWDLKKLYPEYYWQCMSNLLFMGWDGIDFVTFDPRMKEDKHKLFKMEIVPVNSEFDIICKKIESAVKDKLEILRVINQ